MSAVPERPASSLLPNRRLSHNELHQNLMEVWHSGTGLMRHQYRRCSQSGAGNCCCGRDDRAALHNDGEAVMTGVYQQTPDGTWTPAQPLGWLEEHNRLARLIFWLRGIEHCNDREGQRRQRWRR